MDHVNKTRLDNKTGVMEKVKKTDEYRVILFNDDYTTMAFVEEILMKIFHRNPQEAHNIMMQVHGEGSGIAGVYPSWDIAATKTQQVQAEAGKCDFPLLAIFELV
jgi:ATP-dependent Clp protease adaptor protein ClpS